jgi:hypothetical protein
MTRTDAKRSGRRDYPDAPGSLDEWWQRIQWALNDQQVSARGLTRLINPDGAGQGTVGRWLAGDVVNASLTKILAAAEKLGLNPRWLLFKDGKPYTPKPAPLPPVLEKVLFLSKPMASAVVTQALISFYEQHAGLILPEDHWRSIRLKFEQAEAASIGVVDFVEKIREINSFEGSIGHPVDAPSSTPPVKTKKTAKAARPRPAKH